MFEAVELGQSLSKKEFKALEPDVRSSLLAAQRQLKESEIATLVIVAGVEGAGKGDVIDFLNKWLDPRGVFTHAFWDETDEERERPAYWRFWRRLPARGSIAINFGGWYWDPLHNRAAGKIDDVDQDEEAQKITDMERMLYLDGMLIIKLWFHLAQDQYNMRLKARRAESKGIKILQDEVGDPGMYGEFIKSAERLIRHTDTVECPWHLIEADNEPHRDMSVARIILAAMEKRLHEHRTGNRRTSVHSMVTPVAENSVTILDQVNTSLKLSSDKYSKELQFAQKRLNELAWQAYENQQSTVVVFEGWDAAGKGGVIQRMTNAIDPRLYQVISVGAPTGDELKYHYLWRFWRHLPRAGYMTIFDRSWYGRVLVERVERLISVQEWERAYHEITRFEEQLSEEGVLVAKFWLQITPDEQLRRFEERSEKPWKQHKLTDEDWRNREKWEDYRKAVNTMVEHTSIAGAPWTLVPANDKRFARVMVLKTLCDTLEVTLTGARG